MHHKLFKEEITQDSMTCSIRSCEAPSYPSWVRLLTVCLLSSLFLIALIPHAQAEETSLTPMGAETTSASTDVSMMPHLTPISAKPRPVPTPQTPPTSGGGSSCKTLWAWNGQSYVKRDVLSKTGTYIIHGWHCKPITLENKRRYALAPSIKNHPAQADDLTPLPYKWYEEKQK